MRELDWAVTASEKREDMLGWDQTSLLWSLIANVNRNAEENPEPYHPADVHPLRDYDDYAGAADYEIDHRERKLAMLPPKQREAVMKHLYREDHGS